MRTKKVKKLNIRKTKIANKRTLKRNKSYGRSMKGGMNGTEQEERKE